MAITEISVSKIYVLATEPTNKVKDRFWFDTTNNLLKRYDGTSWKPISVSSDDVVVLSSGNKVSLTNYLNTQIAALAEGIDSKQDKLSYYTENISDKSAKISTNNLAISLSEAEEIALTAGNSADSGNIKLSLNSSSIILDSTDALTGELINLLTVQTNRGSISSLSGDLIHKSITSSSTDTQLPTSKAVKTELDKKQNSTDNSFKTTSKTVSGAINELNTKLTSDVVHLSGKETISGTKTFSNIETNNSIIITDYNNDIGILPGITVSDCIADTLVGVDFSNNVASDFIPIRVDGKDYLAANYATKTELDTKQDLIISIDNLTADTVTGAISEINTNKADKATTLSGYGITDTFIYEGTIIIGGRSIKPIKEGDLIDANDIMGAVNRANNDKQGNDITTTYAKVSALDTKQDKSNLVTSISASSTDDQYPSAKAVVTALDKKQNSTDTTLNTTDKTIVGAINELLASINTNVITSTEQKRITTTSSTAGIQMSTTAKVCVVSINPVKTNIGAIYISTLSDTPPTINPLYPDQMPKYKFPDASQVYIWSDVSGDSVDLTIEYYG